MYIKNVFLRMRKIVTLLSMCCAYFYTVAQDDINRIVPPSPNAASLGKFVETPVSLYTGTTRVSVPIWDVRSLDIAFPISLNYHGAGIKVDEIAPWVGLGWNLDAGGAITRTMRGLPDDDLTRGYLNTPPITTTYSYTPAYVEEIQNYMYGKVDSEPDVFYFNFAGRTGKFVLDKSGNAHLIPYQKFRIEKGAQMASWTITTEDGMRYIFSETEVTDIGITNCTSKPLNFVSTWYLKEIISPVNPQNKVTFNYTAETVVHKMETAETRYQAYQGNEVISPVMPCQYNMTVYGKRLDQIVFNGNSVVFEPETLPRTDLTGGYALKKIIVKSGSDVVREFTLAHSYLAGRLMLDQVLEHNDEVRKSPYSFWYYNGLPPRFSTSQDHWGYYNGKGNTTLVPAMIRQTVLGEMHLPGADRRVSVDFAKAGLMYKMEYPTKGYTEFTYESNETGSPEVEQYMYDRNYNLDVRSDHATTPFSINNDTQTTEVSINAYHVCEENTAYGYFTISRVGGGGIDIGPTDFQTQQPLQRFLPNGDYVISYTLLDPSIPDHCDGHGVTITFLEREESVNRFVGGLRVAEVRNYDHTEALVSKKRFLYTVKGEDGTEVSTGQVINGPQYGYDFYKATRVSPEEIRYGTFLVRTSTPNYPLGTSHGSHVVYTEVTELAEDTSGKSNGKTVYRYRVDTEPGNEDSYYGIGTETGGGPGGPSYNEWNAYPFPPKPLRDWAGGMLIDQYEYKGNGPNDYKLVHSINNYYTVYYPNDGYCIGDNTNTNCGEVLGVKAGQQGQVDASVDVRFAYYKTGGGYSELSQSVETNYYYTNEGQPNEVRTEVSASTEYLYNKLHLHPIRIRRSNGTEAEKHVTYNSYPLDYPAGTTFIDNLVANNIHRAPIESIVVSENATTSKYAVLSGKLFRYKDAGNGLVDVAHIFDGQGAALSTFKFSNAIQGAFPYAAANTAFAPDGKYTPEAQFTYNPVGNVVQVIKGADFPVSYIWGYGGEYSIAKVSGAAANTVFHTSFEDDGQTDSQAKTGIKVHAGDYTFTPPGDFSPVANSVLSYWKWNATNSEWVYMEVPYSGGSLTLSGSKIDEVRILPPLAQMSTYTYRPLFGQRSATDEKGDSKYFIYDNVGRLSLRKDNKGNVITHYRYRYKGQQ